MLPSAQPQLRETDGSIAGESSTPPQVAPATPIKESGEVREDEVVRVETTLVTIPVRVMDRDGKYVPDVRQQDFCIYENDAP